MIEVIIGHAAYYFIVMLMLIGFYGMMLKKNLVKKLIGMTILQSSIIIFYVISSYKRGATVPVIDILKYPIDPAQYINPLPHTLMLTAIVVSVATIGVALALIVVIFRRFHTLDENELMERMQ